MRKYGLAVLVLLSGLGLVGTACSSDDTGSPTTTAGDAATASSSITTTAAQEGSAALEGTWVADANDLLAAATANVGGTGGSTCSGQVAMTFDATTLRRTGEITCGSGNVTIDTSSTYSVDGDKLSVSATTNRGRMTVRGVAVPAPDSWGDGTALYKVEGDVLTITFTESSVGTVTSKYTRAD